MHANDANHIAFAGVHERLVFSDPFFQKLAKSYAPIHWSQPSEQTRAHRRNRPTPG
jgi:hypothetical protein